MLKSYRKVRYDYESGHEILLEILLKEDKMLRDRIRVFNKHVTNRVLRGLASSSRGPFAVISHVGRHSGKRYETTIMVWPTREGFVIALTYGPQVDWLRNMLAAGGGTVFWHKKLYTVGKPEPIAAQTALLAFPAPLRLIFRTFRKQEEFVQMKSSGPEPISA
jgi:deazaflavin-dependent oxidoreductase (nitroreductase family)